MALTQNDEIIEDMFPFDQASATPDKLRKVFRSGAYRGTTAAMADGYTQGNLAIIPEKYALDFARFCQRNPQPCPMIGVSDTGNPQMFTLGDDIDIRTDIPSYNIYRNGEFDGSVADINKYWEEKDPSPDTKKNELLDELTERVRYANSNFSDLNKFEFVLFCLLNEQKRSFRAPSYSPTFQPQIPLEILPLHPLLLLPFC